MRLSGKIGRNARQVWLKLTTKRRERRFTIEGLLFIFLSFAVGFAAINTGANLLYLILSMMLSFIVISGAASTINLRGLTARRLLPRHITAGEEANITIDLRNKKRYFPSISLKVFDLLGNGEIAGLSYLLHLGSRSSKSVTYQTVFERRGLYSFRALRVASRFPFGFFDRSIRFISPQEIIVYPRIIPIKDILKQVELGLGEFESGRKGLGTSLFGLREYASGDSARLIHWKVSARARKLMIREFEKEEKKRVSLILYNGLEAPADVQIAEDFEKAVVAAASIAKHLIEDEYNVQLITSSGRVPFGSGYSHLFRILRALAIIELNLQEKPVHKGTGRLDAESTNVYFLYSPTDQASKLHRSFITIDARKLSLSAKSLGLSLVKK